MSERYGWLDRAGNYHECDALMHDDYVHLVLECEVGDVEAWGWVRVFEKEKGWVSCKRLSVEQRHWLTENGYDINEDD